MISANVTLNILFIIARLWTICECMMLVCKILLWLCISHRALLFLCYAFLQTNISIIIIFINSVPDSQNAQWTYNYMYSVFSIHKQQSRIIYFITCDGKITHYTGQIISEIKSNFQPSMFLWCKAFNTFHLASFLSRLQC